MGVKGTSIGAVFFVIASALLLLSPSPSAHASPLLSACRFDQVYQLGDSISDTGNLIRESPLGAALPFARNPYGQTFSHHKATGRCSDGLLMIDYFAQALGLPLLNPIKDTKANFEHGANFAVAGATALSSTVLARHHVRNPVTNSSLDVQLQWMKDHFHKFCHNDCERKLQNALFMVGEIGGNDYNYAFLQYFDEARDTLRILELVPLVVAKIKHAVEKVISFGARTIVVPGNFPMGCLPIYLTKFGLESEAGEFNENHCIWLLNSFATFHNDHLKKAIAELHEKYPYVTIVYGDYYAAYEQLLNLGETEGFELQKACCGVGGLYNFNETRMCGFPGVKACRDPERYVSWDGIHLTQEAYRMIVDWLQADLFWKLRCHH
ncbi:GDSL esterase/lipase At5g03980-like [Coffea arabica]|uniref:GDSL esterase/lipase At5g03980-like n=1 Tax=Coffea arabica TaxID=13443 RepID=A0A6P6VJ19_COFAR|nr:GDSL esterase/lipase At5g03980-like [Coffea arabica]